MVSEVKRLLQTRPDPPERPGQTATGPWPCVARGLASVPVPSAPSPAIHQSGIWFLSDRIRRRVGSSPGPVEAARALTIVGLGLWRVGRRRLLFMSSRCETG